MSFTLADFGQLTEIINRIHIEQTHYAVIDYITAINQSQRAGYNGSTAAQAAAYQCLETCRRALKAHIASHQAATPTPPPAHATRSLASLAEIAYCAYAAQRECTVPPPGQSAQKIMMTPWKDLPSDDHKAWRAAIKAFTQCLLDSLADGEGSE